MKIIGVINIQSSLFISSLSAIGLGALLSVVQVKTPEQFQKTSPFFEEKNDPFQSGQTLIKKQEQQEKRFRYFEFKALKNRISRTS